MSRQSRYVLAGPARYLVRLAEPPLEGLRERRRVAQQVIRHLQGNPGIAATPDPVHGGVHVPHIRRRATRVRHYSQSEAARPPRWLVRPLRPAMPSI